jgi:hypothetical protein
MNPQTKYTLLWLGSLLPRSHGEAAPVSCMGRRRAINVWSLACIRRMHALEFLITSTFVDQRPEKLKRITVPWPVPSNGRPADVADRKVAATPPAPAVLSRGSVRQGPRRRGPISCQGARPPSCQTCGLCGVWGFDATRSALKRCQFWLQGTHLT